MGTVLAGALFFLFVGPPVQAQGVPLVEVPEPLPASEQLVAPEEPLSDDSELAPPIPLDSEELPGSSELEAQEEVETSVSAVREAVDSWVRAWQSRKAQAYFSWYSREFRPARGLSRQAWEAQRRKRVSEPEFIAVELQEVQVRVSSDSGRARVEFVQKYRSNLYEDAVRKVLDLRRETGEWKIFQEQALQLDG
ncbi:MAG: hypothetical protein K0U98_13085 [Deltaproteobacteria bacterium]|nr:hypothetical protein [Deltaproteobacteria bacterium]